MYKRMHLPGNIFGQGSQFQVERYIHSPSRLSIEQGTGCNHYTKHLFQTQRLSAELHFICAMRLGGSSLILHWKWSPISAMS